MHLVDAFASDVAVTPSDISIYTPGLVQIYFWFYKCSTDCHLSYLFSYCKCLYSPARHKIELRISADDWLDMTAYAEDDGLAAERERERERVRMRKWTR